ncbi:hypothetical protein CANCADRAFT_21046 [Tortispora caseinolytica NRRL Y-17796]|uniref:Uncharacterized protein n=1 Tax=Tortispora caseinolytica NRRL Y-17796 TaxID=767744 RepID=A0A1E4TKR1_9ASCO|nr:hypothetical protein CANCADRAFT_21046 [Tortispora caseinolytica NRRL Y-17796]
MPSSPIDGGGFSFGHDNSGVLGSVKTKAEQLENIINPVSNTLRPYLPSIGRMLVILTFLEDSLRLLTQWNQQAFYLRNYRHVPYIFVAVFLLSNICSMLVGSALIMLQKHVMFAVCLLLAVVVGQALIYGLIFDLSFLSRNLSLVGGLVMVLSDSVMRNNVSRGFPGLPELEEKDRKRYYQLAGRIMLVFLFITFLFSGQWTIPRLVVSVLSLALCLMVVLGFKTKLSAAFLVFILTIYNFSANHFWTYATTSARRDFLRYEFFQTMSIVGGLILVASSGAGAISFDEKKKVY